MCQRGWYKMKFQILHKDTVLADVDFPEKTLKENVVVNQYATFWALKPFPMLDDRPVTRQDVVSFIESRCFPKDRFNCKDVLDALGLDSYNVWNIVEKTHGLIFDDYTWLRFENEVIDYKDIKLRK